MTRRADTSIISPLSVVSPQLTKEELEWKQEERAFAEKLVAIEIKIAKHGRLELDVLAKAGVDRKLIVKLLALASLEEGDKGWAALMRSRQKLLRSTAGRLKTLADVAERQAKDSFSKVQSYVILGAHGDLFGVEWPSPLWSDPFARVTISGMRCLAKNWETEATKFGRFLEAFSDVRVNLGMPIALCRVCMLLHVDEPIHWVELATLFSYSFEASGKKRAVSAETLQGIWKKYGKKMLRSFLVPK